MVCQPINSWLPWVQFMEVKGQNEKIIHKQMKSDQSKQSQLSISLMFLLLSMVNYFFKTINPAYFFCQDQQYGTGKPKCFHKSACIVLIKALHIWLRVRLLIASLCFLNVQSFLSCPPARHPTQSGTACQEAYRFKLGLLSLERRLRLHQLSKSFLAALRTLRIDTHTHW